MKLLCAEYNGAGELAYSVLGDNALLRNNEDFYVPDFAGTVSCVPQLVLRVCKLGKGVGERFAGRYYEEVGVGVRFYADDLERSLLDKGLSPSQASSFDGSAAISSLSRREGSVEEWTYALRVNDTVVRECRVEDLPHTPERLIAGMSGYYMLKIGDFIYCGGFPRLAVRIGDRLRLSLNGTELLDFGIK